MTTQNPNPNDPSDPQGGNGELPNYDTGAAFAMTPEPGDGLIRDKKNYLEITALVFGVLAIISMIFDPRSGMCRDESGDPRLLSGEYLPPFRKAPGKPARDPQRDSQMHSESCEATLMPPMNFHAGSMSEA